MQKYDVDIYSRVYGRGIIFYFIRRMFKITINPFGIIFLYFRQGSSLRSVYKYEVGGWAPPTEVSQSSGAAAHTYTWFSLKTYLLIYFYFMS